MQSCVNIRQLIAANAMPIRFARISSKLKPLVGCKTFWSISDIGAKTSKVPHRSHVGLRIKALRAANDITKNPKQCITLSPCGKGEYGGIGLSNPPIKIAKQIMRIKNFKTHP